MEYSFIIKVFASFIVAGTWITIATLIAERYGSKIGGLIASLPSNMAISLLFIALTNNPGFAAQATLAVPAGMIVYTIFFSLYLILLRYGAVKATILSLILWFMLAFAIKAIKINSLYVGILLYLLITLIAFNILHSVIKIRTVKNKRNSYTRWQIILRAAFAGTAVASAVVIASYLGNYWGGIFSTFPAATVSTIVVLSINQNVKFAQAAGKIFLLS